MASRKQIVDKADRQSKKLGDIERSLDRAITEIRDIEWDRPLNEAERKRLGKLKDSLTDVREAIEELGLVTIRALDKSDEAVRIANALKGIVRNLEARHATLKKFVSTAKAFAGITDSITSLAKSVEAFVKPKPTKPSTG